MTPEQAVSKWAAVAAANGWGADLSEDQLDAAREAFRVRIAARALITLLIQKGVFTQAEVNTAQGAAADFFDGQLSTRYPKNTT